MRWLVLVWIVIGVAACSSSYKAKDDLASDAGHVTKPPPPSEDDPQGRPAEPASVPDASPPKDAGHDAPIDAAPGPECTKLSACCDQLDAAGYDTTTCKSVLSTNNDDACYAKYDEYKQFGDCT
jgi:hypothetical protein